MPVFIGSPEDASAALFTSPSNAAMAYINQSVNNFMSYGSSIPSAIGSTIKQKHQELVNSSLSRKVEAMRYKINNLWSDDVIRTMHSIGDIQQTPDVMVRWVMANPTIRNLYHQDRVEGFGDRYVDREPQYVGSNQYDYRRIMDGVVCVNKDTDTASYTTYHEEMIDNDVVLTSIEKASVKMAWDIIENGIEEGDDRDSTSDWNAIMS